MYKRLETSLCNIELENHYSKTFIIEKAVIYCTIKRLSEGERQERHPGEFQTPTKLPSKIRNLVSFIPS